MYTIYEWTKMPLKGHRFYKEDDHNDYCYNMYGYEVAKIVEIVSTLKLAKSRSQIKGAVLNDEDIKEYYNNVKRAHD